MAQATLKEIHDEFRRNNLAFTIAHYFTFINDNTLMFTDLDDLEDINRFLEEFSYYTYGQVLELAYVNNSGTYTYSYKYDTSCNAKTYTDKAAPYLIIFTGCSELIDMFIERDHYRRK